MDTVNNILKKQQFFSSFNSKVLSLGWQNQNQPEYEVLADTIYKNTRLFPIN